MDFTVKDLDWDAFDAEGKRAISLYLVHVNKNGRFGEKYKRYVVKSYHSKTLINVRDQFLEQLKFIKDGGSYANAEQSNIQ